MMIVVTFCRTIYKLLDEEFPPKLDVFLAGVICTNVSSTFEQKRG